MRAREDAKIAALGVGVTAVAAALAQWMGIALPWSGGISADGQLADRLLHPLIHAGVLHALVNVYVLWQLVFFFPIRLRHLLMAYAVAVSCPEVVALWTIDTAETARRVVGLSGVDYALMGWVMPRAVRRLRFNLIVAVWMVVGMAVGSVAVGLHLYGYFCAASASLVVSFVASLIWRNPVA